MTVGELKDQLATFPDDMEIVLDVGENEYLTGIQGVEAAAALPFDTTLLVYSDRPKTVVIVSTTPDCPFVLP